MIKYLIASIIFVVLDGFYISLIKPAFSSQIAAIQGSAMKVNFIAVAITYVLRKHMEPKDAFLFGLVIYAVYEFTNLATFSKWSLYLSVIDTLWGGTLFGLTTLIVKRLGSLF